MIRNTGRWTKEEIAQLRAVAPLGIVMCRHELRRSSRSIFHKAERLGIRVAPSPKGNHAGTRWRGKLPVPIHAHPIVRRLSDLVAALNVLGLTLKVVSQKEELRHAA